MILVVLAALCVVSVPLSGGNLARLAELRLRLLWTAPAALALQVLIVTIAPGGNETVHAVVHIATYALLGVFLWANRRLPGAVLIGGGALTNALAIVVNSGVMPQWATAQRLAGLPASSGFQNSAALAHPHLLWLGDVIPVPAPFGLNNVLSIGDCLIFAGMVVLLHRTCRAAPEAAQPQPAPLANRGASSTADAVLAAAFTSFQAALALWQAGKPSDSPLGRSALASFGTCRAAAAKLPGDDYVLKDARSALERLSHGLAAWQEGAELDRHYKQALLLDARSLGTAHAPHNPRHPIAHTPSPSHANPRNARQRLVVHVPSEARRRKQEALARRRDHDTGLVLAGVEIEHHELVATRR